MAGAEPAEQLESYHTEGYRYNAHHKPSQVSVEQLVQLKQRDTGGGELR